MPTSTSSHSVTVDRSPTELWQLMQAAKTWANIGPVDRVWDPVHAADGSLESYRWSATVAGREYEGTATTITSEPASLLKLDLDGGEVAGVLTTKLSPNGNDVSTLVEVILDVSSRGTLSAMFFPLISDAIRRGLPQQVELFAARLSAAAGPRND